MLDFVRLANGVEVSWDEFSKWSSQKQYANLLSPNKGVKKNKEFGRKISETKRQAIENGVIYNMRKGGDHVLSRKVKTPKGECASLKEATLLYGVSGQTLRKWINSRKEGFEFITPPTKRKSYSKNNAKSENDEEKTRDFSHRIRKTIRTPDGVFYGLKAAAEYYGLTTEGIRARVTIMKWKNWEYV